MSSENRQKIALKIVQYEQRKWCSSKNYVFIKFPIEFGCSFVDILVDSCEMTVYNYIDSVCSERKTENKGARDIMKRVLLKLSGEALAGDKKTGFDEATCMGVAKQVKQLVDDGIQVAIVTGGGNFWRGRTSETIDRVKADQIGMLATVMNCIYVSDIFRYAGMKTEVFTPFVCGSFTTLFSKDAAVAAMERGKVVFFAGGTGHPYFSTDTGAVLRAIEIEADAMLLAKAIDGIYDSDPKVNPEAKKYDEISIQEIIDKKLAAVDLTASIMCLENKMPMLVFGLNEPDSIVETMKGTFTGTKVTV